MPDTDAVAKHYTHGSLLAAIEAAIGRLGKSTDTVTRLGIYDVMKVGDGDLTFPVPWATTSATSFLASPGEYKKALETGGFRVIAERDRREFALDFFAQLQARVASAGGPPPLGLHVLTGETSAPKIRNMIDNVSEGRVAPIELIAEKTS